MIDDEAPRPLIKVCGVVDPREMDVLMSGGASIAGAWWGVPGSSRSLDLAALRAIAAHSRHLPIERCLVTFSSDADAVAEAADALGATWIQLHAFQTPSAVASLRQLIDTSTALAGTRILKVLHLDKGALLEGPFLRAYARAGVDVYLLDTVADGLIGSTGVRADVDALSRAAQRLDAPFLIAGGLDATAAGELGKVRDESRWIGIDVDTNARDGSGCFDSNRIGTLTTTWTRSSRTRADAEATR